MGEETKHAVNVSILYFVIVLAVSVGVFFGWLFWPYPSVTKTGTSVVINTPESGYFKTGDVIRWTTPEVCQPNGDTKATVYAVLEFETDFGIAISKTPVVSRDFIIPKGFPTCAKDNPTSAWVDGDLPTGTYRFEILACVYNPTPQPKCELFDGPNNVRIVRVSGNE